MTQQSQSLSKYSIVVLADSSINSRMIGQLFSGRGADVRAMTSLDAAVASIEESCPSVFIAMEQGLDEGSLTQLVQDIRNLKDSPKIIWTISKELIPLADGFSPYPFNPAELLKPVYFSLLIEEDLRAKA